MRPDITSNGVLCLQVKSVGSLIASGRKEGWKDGRKDGRMEGRKDGRKEGRRKEGRKEEIRKGGVEE